MDPFEEFEIKPLSEGLGFHKKTTTLSDHVKKSGLPAANSRQVPSFTNEDQAKIKPSNRPQAFEDLLKALERPVSDRAGVRTAAKAGPSITEPLPGPSASPRRASMANPDIEMPRPVTPEFPSLNPRPMHSPLSKTVESVGLKRGAADSPLRMLERASASFSAAALDGVVIFALSLIFLVALMTITNVDLGRLVFSVGLDMPTKFAFTVLFLSVMLMYVVVVRSFFGRTLGEWTFDLQMGDDQQHERAIYPLMVLWRSALVVATGVVLFPLLSLALGRDLLAPLTGLQLYRQR